MRMNIYRLFKMIKIQFQFRFLKSFLRGCPKARVIKTDEIRFKQTESKKCLESTLERVFHSPPPQKETELTLQCHHWRKVPAVGDPSGISDTVLPQTGPEGWSGDDRSIIGRHFPVVCCQGGWLQHPPRSGHNESHDLLIHAGCARATGRWWVILVKDEIDWSVPGRWELIKMKLVSEVSMERLWLMVNVFWTVILSGRSLALNINMACRLPLCPPPQETASHFFYLFF